MDKTVNVCLVFMDKISIKANQFILQNVQYESTGPVHCCWHLNLCLVCILIWYYFHCGSRFRLCTRSSVSMYCFCARLRGPASEFSILQGRLILLSHNVFELCPMYWRLYIGQGDGFYVTHPSVKHINNSRGLVRPQKCLHGSSSCRPLP